ncbi:phosphatase PAP2 family protein [Micromonospora sp. LH3U1]|uniref:phosphatase PAP2 family protein n=1 Tax=Micromonospora sp. LH3U1 TaxID=3018339 RepID=UPI00234B6D51|nr:phosphatase PAP2 family protein [Micromonospora sp. LH3U1]WCN84399.1 phosphatase PAP2 family protein [Micromonospora sp. LH3U1]
MDTAELSAARPAAPGRRAAALRRAMRELGLVAALFLAYKAARVAVADRASTAVGNGEWIWRVERLIHLPNEAAVQRPVLSLDLLVHLANGYYAYVHFPATAICLIWLYVRHPVHYLWTRRMLAGLTAAALVLHILVPLAPPRLTALTGMVDTGSRYGPAVYGPPDTDALSNQYAAMPSLHVGWAIAVAVALIAVTGGRLRWLWLAHPLATLLVVVCTGNHYWLDGIVAAMVLTAVCLVLSTPRTGGRSIHPLTRHPTGWPRQRVRAPQAPAGQPPAHVDPGDVLRTP